MDGQLLRGCVEFGLDPQASAEIAEFHSDHAPFSFVPYRSVPRSLIVEAGVGAATVADCGTTAHLVSVVPNHTLGRICAVGLDAGMGVVLGDPRGPAFALLSRGQVKQCRTFAT